MKETRIPMILVLAAVLALALSAACSEPLTLTEVFAGKAVPLTLKAKELGTEWRQFTLKSDDTQSPIEAMMMAQMYGGPRPGMQMTAPQVYYTRGDVVVCGGESYLLAYTGPQQAVDMQRLLQRRYTEENGGDYEEEEPAAMVPFTEDTVFSLALLNLRSVMTMQDIRPFDLKAEIEKSRQAIAEQQKQAEQKKLTGNLRQLAVAVMMFCQDNDETFPKMKTAADLKGAVMNYAGNEKLFISPTTGEPYQPNASLSEAGIGDVERPDAMVLLYDTKPAEGGLRYVAYVDGHVAGLTEEEWTKAKKASGIP